MILRYTQFDGFDPFWGGSQSAMGGIGGIMGFAGTVGVLGKLQYIYAGCIGPAVRAPGRSEGAG